MIASAAGKVALDAGADIDLSAARVRGAQGAQVIAGGNILLDARQEVKRNTDQTVASHGVQASELIDWNGGDSPVYKEITVTVKDSTTTTTVDSVRHIGTMLDGGAGDLTVVAGGNVTGRGATLTSQGRTTVQGANVDLRALVDRTTTTTDVVQHAYSDQPAEHSVETKEVLSGGTVQGGHGVTIVAHSDQAGQGNVTLAGVRVNGGVSGSQLRADHNIDVQVSSCCCRRSPLWSCGLRAARCCLAPWRARRLRRSGRRWLR